MIGYKGMNLDMTCRGMKFEVGKTYHVGGEIKLCRNGLHFCENLRDVFGFYPIADSRFFVVETGESAIVKKTNDKAVSSDLTIIREIDAIEVSRCYYGYGNGDGNGDGNGNGNGYGNGDGYGYGNGYGYGDGYGYGNGNGNGNGDGYGYGNGNGNGYGDGYGFRLGEVVLLKK